MTLPRISYDVIIIGAGSIGAPTAYYLTKQGLSVLVLDRYASVGQGSNKRAIGGVRATHSEPAKIRLCLRSLDIFSTWKESHGDDIEWMKGGYCFIAYREEEQLILEKLVRLQKSLGLDINWYSSADILQIVPDLNPEGLMGGTFSPQDGSISPLLMIEAFYRHALKNGATFRFNERVRAINVHSSKITSVLTDRNRYDSTIVINTSGAWASDIGKLCGMNLPVIPESHEAAITEPVQPFLKPMVVDIQTKPGSSNFYFYQHVTGQIMFCISPKPSIAGFDTRETSEFLPMASQRLLQVMPRLANLRVRRTWRGLYPMTPDGSPIVGWSREVQGFLQAVGMCGQGLMLGPGLAELLCRMVYNQTTPDDLKILEFISPYRQFVGQELLK